MSQENFIAIKKLLSELAAGDTTKYQALIAIIKSFNPMAIDEHYIVATHKDAKTSETRVSKKSIVECILDEFLKAIDSSTIIAKFLLDVMLVVKEKSGNTLTATNSQQKPLMAILREKAATTAGALWVQALENSLYIGREFEAIAKSKLSEAQNTTIHALVCNIATTNDYDKFKGIVIFPTNLQLKNEGVLQKALDLIRSKPITKIMREAKFKEFLTRLATEIPKVWTINEFATVATKVGLRKPAIDQKVNATKGTVDMKDDSTMREAVGAVHGSPAGLTPDAIVSSAPTVAASGIANTDLATSQPIPSPKPTAVPPGP